MSQTLQVPSLDPVSKIDRFEEVGADFSLISKQSMQVIDSVWFPTKLLYPFGHPIFPPLIVKNSKVLKLLYETTNLSPSDTQAI